MLDINDKRRVYWLIDKYLSEHIGTKTFSDEFYACFDIGGVLATLSSTEKAILSELSTVAARFSPYTTDHQECPGVYFTEKEVRQKAAEVKRKLADYWPDELKE